ncbi:LUD domain-containing protein [Halorussus aquaticus]|uniref:LUD domain-containing protein n=1 Tax=Halorussus aquaticus TaxID=2953748 RepID=UPI0020B80F7C|nr:LUD domain-containing protein [Halorussus aquaticus]
METDILGQSEASLRRMNVGRTRVEAESFEAALTSVVETPAVGSPLPFEGVSLADTEVELDPTPAQLRAAKTGVTAVELGVADYGSVVVRSSPGGDEPVSLFPETHVAVLRESDVVPDMPAAFERLESVFAAGGDDVVVATGPSATADMGELVYGAHGPKAVHVLLLEDR